MWKWSQAALWCFVIGCSPARDAGEPPLGSFPNNNFGIGDNVQDGAPNPTPDDDPGWGGGGTSGPGEGQPPDTQPDNPTTQPVDPGPPAGPIDACYATASGQLGQGSDPIVFGGEPVKISAEHSADARCLTRLTLAFSRKGACPMTLNFGVQNGSWALDNVSLTSTPECGDGWGSGKTYTASGDLDGTLLAVPGEVAHSVGQKSCTALQQAVVLAGSIPVTAGDGKTIQITFTGLSVSGNLLSQQVAGGVCGQSPTACAGLECGLDPLFGTSCGGCGSGYFCLAGACQQGTPAQEACARFNQDRKQMTEGGWSGSIGQCQAGSMSDQWQQSALLNVNLYRWFAGLEPLSVNANWIPGQQACALLLDANNSLSHNPPGWWSCYSQSGAASAGKSNIATMPAVVAGDLYMIDPGNESTMGHRRWILSNWLSQTAFGSTSDYSCMATQQSGGGVANAAWTAWPPAGYYPLDWHDMGWTDTDSTGWTIQSDSISLSGKQVTVVENGQSRPVTVSNLSSGYGSKYAIKLTPIGWQMKANSTYTVKVSGTNIVYDIDAVDCSKLP